MYIIDIETNGLLDCDTIHCIVLKELNDDELQVFDGPDLYSRFKVWADALPQEVGLCGHNIIGFDLPVLDRLCRTNLRNRPENRDTLVLSRLFNVSRTGGHSLEAWGNTLKFKKGDYQGGWETYSPEMLAYCKQDVLLSEQVYLSLKKIIDRNPGVFDKAIECEHKTQSICEEMSHNGFFFNKTQAELLDNKLKNQLSNLDAIIQNTFPPKIKTIQLKTKTKTVVTPFNPGSPKQMVERLWESGWKPVEKTKTHAQLSKRRNLSEPDTSRLKRFSTYGWKINERNLATLPEEAPEGAKRLVEHLLLSARRRTLAEWSKHYSPTTGRIHGKFNPLGTRTQRCSHQAPNMGNIATQKTIKYNTDSLRDLAIEYGGRMRSLWICPQSRKLTGIDLASAHLRIFAGLINDPEFITSLDSGDKDEGTDPHSVNMRKFGPKCVDRDRAKTAIFTLLNGGGIGKLSEIFNCSKSDAKEAYNNFISEYPGLQKIHEERVPVDVKRGYFEGVDGRYVRCVGESPHKLIGMYLQNTETLIMKYSMIHAADKLKDVDYKLINWVHDEVVVEAQEDLIPTIEAAYLEGMSIYGQRFSPNCPLFGEAQRGYTWLEVH